MPEPWRFGPHPAVVESQKVQALSPLHQVDDPRLCRLWLQTKVSENRRQDLKCPLSLPPTPTQHYQVIAEAHKHTGPGPSTPSTIKLVQIDVSQQC